MHKRFARLTLIVGLWIVAFMAALPVQACSPANWRIMTMPELTDEADIVVIATVIGTTNLLVPYDAQYTIQVETYLKGAGAALLMVTGYGSGSGDCLNALRPGDRWLFFLDGNPATDAMLQASYAQVYAATAAAAPENIQAIAEHTGQTTAPTNASLALWWRALTLSPFFQLLPYCLMPLGIGISAAMVLRRCYRHKQKRV